MVLKCGWFWECLHVFWSFSGGSTIKNPPTMQELQEMWVQSRGWENPLEEEDLLHYSCLQNPMDRGAGRTMVHGFAKSQTWLKWRSTCAGYFDWHNWGDVTGFWWIGLRDAKHSTIQGRAFHTKNTLVQMTRGPCWEQPSQDGLLFPKFFKNSWQVYVILNAQTMLLDSYMPHSFISLFSTTLIIFVRETHH